MTIFDQRGQTVNNQLSCEHGQLKRSCNICELEQERDEWKRRAKMLWEALEFTDGLGYPVGFGEVDEADLQEEFLIANPEAAEWFEEE